MPFGSHCVCGAGTEENQLEEPFRVVQCRSLFLFALRMFLQDRQWGAAKDLIEEVFVRGKGEGGGLMRQVVESLRALESNDWESRRSRDSAVTVRLFIEICRDLGESEDSGRGYGGGGEEGLSELLSDMLMEIGGGVIAVVAADQKGEVEGLVQRAIEVLAGEEMEGSMGGSE